MLSLNEMRNLPRGSTLNIVLEPIGQGTHTAPIPSQSRQIMLLVTGGCGYIGSHSVVECILAGYEVVVFDNLSNSTTESLTRIADITGKEPAFFHGCITNELDLVTVFELYKIDAVLHFAGLKSVSESFENPLEYFNVNAFGTMTLLNVMKRYHCHNNVFSSSATVYGNPQTLPITEDHPLAPINPYGKSKLHASKR